MKSAGPENRITRWQQKHRTQTQLVQEVLLLQAKFNFIIITVFFIYNIVEQGEEKCEDFQNKKITANVGQITAIRARTEVLIST